MQITGKHIFFGGVVLSFIAFVGLLIWKIAFKGNIPTQSLFIIGIIEVAMLLIYCFLYRKH